MQVSGFPKIPDKQPKIIAMSIKKCLWLDVLIIRSPVIKVWEIFQWVGAWWKENKKSQKWVRGGQNQCLWSSEGSKMILWSDWRLWQAVFPGLQPAAFSDPCMKYMQTNSLHMYKEMVMVQWHCFGSTNSAFILSNLSIVLISSTFSITVLWSYINNREEENFITQVLAICHFNDSYAEQIIEITACHINISTAHLHFTIDLPARTY